MYNNTITYILYIYKHYIKYMKEYNLTRILYYAYNIMC